MKPVVSNETINISCQVSRHKVNRMDGRTDTNMDRSEYLKLSFMPDAGLKFERIKEYKIF